MTEKKVSYCFLSSPFGRLLVAATPEGICFLDFRSRDESLLAALKRHYPHSTAAAPDSVCWQLAGRVAEYLEHPQEVGDGMLSIPLDVEGTAFQKRVWEALRQIPTGITTTYSDLAARLGMPGGARAVAHANATNPVSVLIPCHRVLRRDGGLGGYGGGLEVKKALLRAEGAAGLLDL